MSKLVQRDTDGKAVAHAYPLPATPTYDSAYSFNVAGLTANATTAVSIKSATAGKSHYITNYAISAGGAGWVELLDGDATRISARHYLAANGNIDVPLPTPKKVVAAKAITIKSENAVNIGYSVDGYTL